MAAVIEPFGKVHSLVMLLLGWKQVHCIKVVTQLNEGSQAGQHGSMDWLTFCQCLLKDLQKARQEVFGPCCFSIQAGVPLVRCSTVCEHAKSKVCKPAAGVVQGIQFFDLPKQDVQPGGRWLLLPCSTIYVTAVVQQGASQVIAHPPAVEDVETVSSYQS